MKKQLEVYEEMDAKTISIPHLSKEWVSIIINVKEWESIIKEILGLCGKVTRHSV